MRYMTPIFCWSKLSTRDRELSGHFLTELFGWSQRRETHPSLGQCTVFSKDGEDVAWAVSSADAYCSDLWVQYLKVENVNRAVERAVRLGAKLLTAPEMIPGIGQIAVIADAARTTVGLIGPEAP